MRERRRPESGNRYARQICPEHAPADERAAGKQCFHEYTLRGWISGMSELRNIIDMRRYYAKTVFGFAVAKTNLPVSRLPDAAEFKSFEALEIQHEQLDAMSVFRREALWRLTVINFPQW